MKNMWRYASYGKISQTTVDPQDAADLVASFQKEFPDLLKWGQMTVAKLESDK